MTFQIAAGWLIRGSRRVGAAVVAAALLVSCGGGEPQPAPTPTPQATISTLRAKAKVLAQSASTASLAEQLFDLAETAYPGIFSTHESTHAFYGFYYRYYPATGVYLGVVYDAGYGFELNGVYATGGIFGGGFTYGGPLTNFVSAPPPVPPMQVGTLPFSLVYAATSFGIDSRSTPATYASDNTLSAYNFSVSESPQIGTLTNVETEGTQTVQIGRWTNGTFAGRFYSLVDSTHSLSLNANQGFHYAITTVPEKLPCSGSKTYTLAAATHPTFDDGSVAPGTLDQITATVTFNGASAPTVAVSGSLTIDGAARTFSGTEANTFNNTFAITAMTSQTAGISGGQLRGAFGGADAAQLGVVVSGLRANSSPFTKQVYVAARLAQTQSTSVACN
ncbi:hypothetical protein GHT07_04255 [Caenimonas koreensis DSM 17982]|uniref:Transferrin-binding protein B C-lobe/N-lobe beta barrel domain-containing protein n=1 Tax=Caenimonas koreensis DSM 17982 TaxID=1121255 RepID=A0A844AQL9_9BURK|nr:hypothetical protein [Caenimonas koreensis]MRD46475.1 hypothetical protein [Caenimonas koreensis DSM 17982]